MEVIWKKCSVETYRAIFTEFKDRLNVYSVAGNHGPVHMTTWGMEDWPMIKSEGKKKDDGYVSDSPEDWEYFISVGKTQPPNGVGGE